LKALKSINLPCCGLYKHYDEDVVSFKRVFEDEENETLRPKNETNVKYFKRTYWFINQPIHLID
jgi:hypothetical protein